VTIEIEYISAFKLIFEDNQRYESGARRMLLTKRNRIRKPHARVPLISGWYYSPAET
jgi:hypothetical protein